MRKERFDSLEDVLGALERAITGIGPEPARSVLGREFDPVRQVAGRFELRGPDGVRGGIDVRGDGSAEAYRGWIRKEVIERQAGETAIEALRRALAD